MVAMSSRVPNFDDFDVLGIYYTNDVLQDYSISSQIRSAYSAFTICMRELI